MREQIANEEYLYRKSFKWYITVRFALPSCYPCVTPIFVFVVLDDYTMSFSNAKLKMGSSAWISLDKQLHVFLCRRMIKVHSKVCVATRYYVDAII